MMDNNSLPPYRNTGAMDTTPKPLRALVDWCAVTFKGVNNLENVTQLLNLNYDLFTINENGGKGYKNSAFYGHIKVYWGTPDKAQDMGTHVEMSGQGCREYENHFNLNHDWTHFFALCMNFDHKFTRLDIAIDDFKGYFTINQAYRCAKRGCMTATRVSKGRDYEEFFIKDGKTFGRTLYIGKSDWIVRFYDKLPERLNKGIDYTNDLKCWNRYEIQLRDKVATEAAHVLAYEAYSLGEFVKGFLKAKIDFKINNTKDTNKSRWKSQKWWKNFLGDVEPLSLTQVAPDPSIQKVGIWLDRQVQTSLATYLKAFDDNPIVIDYLTLKGQERMGKEQERMLLEFSKERHLKNLMLRDMQEYVQEKRLSQPTTD